MEAITNAMVRGLRPRDRVYEVTCGRLTGFAVRVLPTGKKVFVVRHRVDGRDQRRRLGPWGPELPVEEARRQAMAILGGDGGAVADDVELDEDEPAPGAAAGRSIEPAKERPSARRREPERRSNEPLEPSTSQISVREIAERFVREYVDVYLKSSSAKAYRRILERYILPELGGRAFDSVTRRDVKALHAKLYDRSTLADYVLCVLGSLYTRIIDDWELVEMRNPTAGIKRRPSRRIERFLSPEERRAVVAEIEAGLRVPRGKAGHIEPASAWALMLLMHTGQRRNEVITMRWEMVDWQHACIHFPDTKTGQRSAPVSSEAMALLREIHDATGSPRSGPVIRGRNGGTLTRINDTWDRIRRAVGIADVRLHDLRHSFASDALMAGVPLAIVGEMLGHKQVNTTKRYAHLSDQAVRSALETTAKRISKASRGPGRAEALGREREGEREMAPFVPLTDAQWGRIAPLLGVDKPRGGVPVDLRGIVDGIRWVQQRKARWRDVPERYGMPTTCWRWFRRWTEVGVWGEVVALLAA